MNLHKRKVLHPELLEGNVGQRWTNFFSSSDFSQPSIVGAHFLRLARPAVKGSTLSILLAPMTIEATDGVVVWQLNQSFLFFAHLNSSKGTCHACHWNLTFLFQFAKKDGKALFRSLDLKALVVAGIAFLSCETMYQAGVFFSMLLRFLEVMLTETVDDLVGIETNKRHADLLLLAFECSKLVQIGCQVFIRCSCHQ